MIFNASEKRIRFKVCPSPGLTKWYLAIDTARESPDDIREEGTEVPLETQDSYMVESRSMVVMISR